MSVSLFSLQLLVLKVISGTLKMRHVFVKIFILPVRRKGELTRYYGWNQLGLQARIQDFEMGGEFL